MLRRIPLLLLVCALSLVFAASARADLLSDIAKDYTDDQQLDACKYSEKDLKALKDAVPNDIEAYDAGFLAALDDALARRASGACNKNKAGSGSGGSGGSSAAPGASGQPPAGSGQAPASGTPSTPGQPGVAQPPPTPDAALTAAPAIAQRDAIGIAANNASNPSNTAPFPLLALAVLLGLLSLGGLLFALARWRAWEPSWADGMRHSAGEAGWRVSSTWSDFADFVRLGR